MTDIVERLNDLFDLDYLDFQLEERAKIQDAITEIQSLRARVDELERELAAARRMGICTCKVSISTDVIP